MENLLERLKWQSENTELKTISGNKTMKKAVEILKKAITEIQSVIDGTVDGPTLAEKLHIRSDLLIALSGFERAFKFDNITLHFQAVELLKKIIEKVENI
jgi:hypothetical protein